MKKARKHRLSESDRAVLRDVLAFLRAPHSIQELLASEKTPTLPFAIAAFEGLLLMFEQLAVDLPRLRHAINVATVKLRKYIRLARQTKVYGLATGKDSTLLDPCVRLCVFSS
jgi:hypothetical protein